MFSTFDLEQDVIKRAKVTEFPGFVLIESNDMTHNEPFAVRTERFVKLMEEHGNIDWAFDLHDIWSEDLCYHAVKPKYMRDYIENPDCESKYTDLHASIRMTAEDGRLDLIVNDQTSNDGYMYDLNGDPVYRYFHINIVERDYQLEQCKEHLERRQSDRWTCTVSRTYEVPWFNVDGCGKNQFDIFYKPADYAEFLKVYKLATKQSSYVAEKYMEKSLGLEQYYKDPYGSSLK